MRKIELTQHAAARRACDNAIFITGNGRSGTTILGKLIHSMRGVEYVFEPPTLVSLLPLIGELDESHFRLLFETCCYEDLLMGQISGRAFNLNRHDDSCIHLTKPAPEIERRLNAVWSKALQAEAAEGARLAIKVPDMAPCLRELRRLYPSMTFIVLQRNANSVIQSVLRRAWFRDSSLERLDIMWPTQTPDFTTPFWVAREDVGRWRGWSELERAGYYYLRLANGADGVEGVRRVSYERLVQEPEAVVRELADALGLAFGECTPRLISETFAKTELAEDWVAQLPEDMRRQLAAVAA
jgi:LPS sulfotransferase NodH